MIWTLNIVLLVVMTWPASAADNPCGHVQKDPEFTACWHEQFKKSEAEVAQRLRVLAARHRKDEPELAKLMTRAQQTWLAWREASCRVETFEFERRYRLQRLLGPVPDQDEPGTRRRTAAHDR